jgi:hypothetical protein
MEIEDILSLLNRLLMNKCRTLHKRGITMVEKQTIEVCFDLCPYCGEMLYFKLQRENEIRNYCTSCGCTFSDNSFIVIEQPFVLGTADEIEQKLEEKIRKDLETEKKITDVEIERDPVCINCGTPCVDIWDEQRLFCWRHKMAQKKYKSRRNMMRSKTSCRYCEHLEFVDDIGEIRICQLGVKDVMVDRTWCDKYVDYRDHLPETQRRHYSPGV